MQILYLLLVCSANAADFRGSRPASGDIRIVAYIRCSTRRHWSSQTTTTFEHTKLHHIQTKSLFRPYNIFMSLLNLTKRTLTRPISSSAFIAVGIAFLLFLYKTRSDISVQQPAITKKMHIQSIPMCEFAPYVPSCDTPQGCSQALADARRSAQVPGEACRIQILNTD
jgi:hypothetical protein